MLEPTRIALSRVPPSFKESSVLRVGPLICRPPWLVYVLMLHIFHPPSSPFALRGVLTHFSRSHLPAHAPCSLQIVRATQPCSVHPFCHAPAVPTSNSAVFPYHPSYTLVPPHLHCLSYTPFPSSIVAHDASGENSLQTPLAIFPSIHIPLATPPPSTLQRRQRT